MFLAVFGLSALMISGPRLAPQAQGVNVQVIQDEDTPERRATLEKVKGVLKYMAPALHVDFSQPSSNPWNWQAYFKNGLTNTLSLETLVMTRPKGILAVRVYPHLVSGYMNVDKAHDAPALMRSLFRLNQQGIFYWSADKDGDVYAEFKFTLESGFPADSLKAVLNEVTSLDAIVGTVRKFADGDVPQTP